MSELNAADLNVDDFIDRYAACPLCQRDNVRLRYLIGNVVFDEHPMAMVVLAHPAPIDPGALQPARDGSHACPCPLPGLARTARTDGGRMIDVRVLDIKPHPDQATNNPGCWAVRLEVAYDGRRRTFWRWHSMREVRGGCYVVPSDRKPMHPEILAEFWDNTFGDLHGFAFNKEDPCFDEEDP